MNSEKSAVLISQRRGNDPHKGKWEFPGGKIESGESPIQALVRELEEELGILVKTAKPYDILDYQYPHQQVNLNFFLVTEYSGHMRGVEGQRIDWVPVYDLARIDMLEANNLIIDRLQTSPGAG